MPMTRSATGAFVGYDLFVEHASGRTSVNGAFEAVIFTPHGVGATNFIVQAGSGRERVTRLETSWTIDRPASMTTIRIGDAISSAGPGAVPFRFGGIQFARSFDVQPGFLTMPLLSTQGSAAVASVVDIYVNNALQGSRQVAPGPFEIGDIPVQTGGGDVRIVVRDLLGRETVTEQSYYSSAQLLRRGLHDFSFEAGFIRRDVRPTKQFLWRVHGVDQPPVRRHRPFDRRSARPGERTSAKWPAPRSMRWSSTSPRSAARSRSAMAPEGSAIASPAPSSAARRVSRSASAPSI